MHRRLLAPLLALALVVPAIAGRADVPFDGAERVGGDDPVATAVAVSHRLYPDGGAGAVVLARVDTFPDALGASSLTVDVDAPLLLTPSDRLPTAVEDEIDRLLDSGGTVYLLGGTGALSGQLERRLDDLGYRTPRFPGAGRIETAAMIARFVGAGPEDTAVLVRASGDPDNEQGWVDSVSCGAWAADTGTPVLLTTPGTDTVAEETLETLDFLGITKVVVCGGTAAVPAAQVDQLQERGVLVARYAGAGRVDTAVDVAVRLWGVQDRVDRSFVVVPGFGTDFAFGLVSAPLAARLDAPLLLVGDAHPTSCDDPIAGPTLCYLDQIGPGAAGGVVAVGGTGIIADAVLEAAASAAGLSRDTTPPPVPTDVTATEPDEDDGLNVDVAWQGSDESGVTYTVYLRQSTAEGDMTRVNASVRVESTATEIRVTVPEADIPYDVAVDAVDQFGNRSAFSAVVQVTPEDEVPSAPPSDTAPGVAADGDDLVISWVPAPEADVAGYVVERAAQTGPPLGATDCDGQGLGDSPPDWEDATRIDVPGADTSSVVDPGQAGSDWCYRYRVYDDSDPRNETAPSGVQEYDAP